jgi:hypothetical protein
LNTILSHGAELKAQPITGRALEVHLPSIILPVYPHLMPSLSSPCIPTFAITLP